MTTASLTPKVRLLPVRDNALNLSHASTKTADSSPQMLTQLLFDPRNNAGLSLKTVTQEGDLA